jgi:hypothetical protein
VPAVTAQQTRMKERYCPRILNVSGLLLLVFNFGERSESVTDVWMMKAWVSLNNECTYDEDKDIQHISLYFIYLINFVFIVIHC